MLAGFASLSMLQDAVKLVGARRATPPIRELSLDTWTYARIDKRAVAVINRNVLKKTMARTVEVEKEALNDEVEWP